MIKFFTYLLSHKIQNQEVLKRKSNVDKQFYEPSETSVKTILDFSRAYHPAKLKNCEESDILLN